MTQHFICDINELEEGQSRGFDINDIEFFIIKSNNEIKAYRNHCPHLGVPLNWQEDDFLSLDNSHIQCATHGALFTLDKGQCIAGPCIGQALQSLATTQEDSRVFLSISC